MTEKFKNNKTKEIVHIVDNTNDMFIELSNGVQIKRDLFVNMFTPYYDYLETVDPESFMNQKTQIKVEKPMTPEQKMQADIANNKKKIQESTKFLQNTGQLPPQNIEVVDAIDFLYGNNNSIMEVSNQLKNVDTTKVADVPESMKTEVKMNENNVKQEDGLSLEQRADLVRREWNTTAEQRGELKMTTRLNEEDLSKFKQVDEDDPNVVLQIKQNVPQKPKSKVNPETGLTPREELIRKQQIDAGQGDPYSQRVMEWQAQKAIEAPIVNTDEVLNKINTDVMKQPVEQTIEQPIQNNAVNNMANSMFDMLEKVYNISIDISIKEKIAEPAFIRMFAKNLKGDVIDYYAQQMLKDLLGDIPGLKKKIYNKIKSEVYGEHKELFDEMIDNSKKDEEIEEVIESVKENNNLVKTESIIVTQEKKLIPGKITKTGKQQYKFVNEKGKVIDCLPETAKKKGYKAHVEN